MRSAGVLLVALLAGGCAKPMHFIAPPPVCDAAKVQRYIGETATPSLGKRAQRRAGAQLMRWRRPGEIVTLEHRADRLEIKIDEQNGVRALRCG